MLKFIIFITFLINLSCTTGHKSLNKSRNITSTNKLQFVTDIGKGDFDNFIRQYAYREDADNDCIHIEDYFIKRKYDHELPLNEQIRIDQQADFGKLVKKTCISLQELKQPTKEVEVTKEKRKRMDHYTLKGIINGKEIPFARNYGYFFDYKNKCLELVYDDVYRSGGGKVMPILKNSLVMSGAFGSLLHDECPQ